MKMEIVSVMWLLYLPPSKCYIYVAVKFHIRRVDSLTVHV